MLFNSYVFAVFFLVVYALYLVLPHRGQNRMLLVASYIFYGAWDWRFLSLIFISTAIDYVAGHGIHNAGTPGRRRLWLTLSMATNLTFLGFFKYFNFFIAQFEALMHLAGVDSSWPMLKIILPVGISFYTFQSMSYAIDVYRREAEVATSFLDFALFVSFFPQLVAGPIERYTALMDQVIRPRTITQRHIVEGVYHLLFGLFKKVVIADNMAPLANAVFGTPTDDLTGPLCVLGLIAFAFQIYGDFSGYSSMAQGLANLLGFELMYNFKSPYFATTPSDFWSRWHISLSTWLRDYLYVPLGGNRYGTWRTYRNLMITMLLGGLWHGAAWTYIGWGFFHGLILCLYRAAGIRQASKDASTPRFVLGMATMFFLTLVGWLLFRAESLAQVQAILWRIGTNVQWTELATFYAATMLFFVTPLLVLEYQIFRHNDDMLWLLAQPRWLRAGVYVYFAWMIFYFSPDAVYEFIYFQF